MKEVAYLSLINTQISLLKVDGAIFGIYETELCYLSHAYICLTTGLFEVVMLKMIFKFGDQDELPSVILVVF